ncbi:polyribonucleotide nucleotidyltransferase [candidate division WWE3 bacterium CG10_big_fil_rev_8_21_14_0_10_35_32]|nr:MAG: polyribonucleotide nucleotidyltransferase [candidate division WWE3 bacterium CG10_big_fil_rev_8_21_14_0_10_35_32]
MNEKKSRVEDAKNEQRVVVSETMFNGEKLIFESGKIANSASIAITATLGETVVLVTVVSSPGLLEGDYFPLRVEYEERFYAGGQIGGSRFTRREGRPTDEASVSARLMDHAIRPLFPKDFMDETQIITTVLAYDSKNSPVLLGFLAASAALFASGIPFKGPLVPLRIQKTKGEITFGLSDSDEDTDMDLIVTYLENGSKIQAIEAHANIVPEAEVVKAINSGAEVTKQLFDFQVEFAKKMGLPVREYTRAWLNADAVNDFKADVLPVVSNMYDKGFVFESKEWHQGISEVEDVLFGKFKEIYSLMQVKALVSEVEKEFIRDLVLNKNKRIDGRSIDEIRPLSAEVGLLPRVHGSALFNRGKTQSLSITTLASGAQKQLVQNMDSEEEKRYMHHYNFPPYSTGEVRGLKGPGRREIGHGMLAEKALVPVLPREEDFGYAIRVVSEITSSNGSTSMAATCASSLSLMDAGVPISEHVGGIGIGLFVDSDKADLAVSDYMLLTDIIGYEDFAGYMDFKMTGTKNGMTAIQMELKVQGVPLELVENIFEKSRIARLKVLDVMNSAISVPRDSVSTYAPKLVTIKIEKSIIGQVIGSGGSVIKGIMEDYDCEVDVSEKEDHALVSIAGIDIEKINAAKDFILSIVTPVEVGDVFEGKVTRVETYGAFVEIAPKKEGLLHVSEYSYEFVEDITKLVSIGDVLKVKVNGLENGKISLSKKDLEERPEGYVETERKPRPQGGGGFGSTGRRDDRRGGKRF